VPLYRVERAFSISRSLLPSLRSDRKLEPLKIIGHKPSLFLFTMTKGNINIASTETPSRAEVDAHEPPVESSAISPCPSGCVSSSPVALPTRLNLLLLLDDLLAVVFFSSSFEGELLNPKKLPKVLLFP